MSQPFDKLSSRSLRGASSILGPGTTLTAATEARALHLRKAVSIVLHVLADQDVAEPFRQLFGARWEPLQLNGGDLRSRAAWALVTSRIVGRLLGDLGGSCSFRDAEDWFVGPLRHEIGSVASLISNDADARACKMLERIGHDESLSELLPYVLEIHGPGSRASVMRNPRTRHARDTKRSKGVFYTPPDVAEYMTRVALEDSPPPQAGFRCLDPACGTGVFLRAVLTSATEGKADRFRFAIDALYGVDTSLHAVESACFVLLHDCLIGGRTVGIPPWSAWHALRLNLAVADATALARPVDQQAEIAQARMRMRRELLVGAVLPAASLHSTPTTARSSPALSVGRVPLDELFPEAAAGFDLLICNPPYAQIGPTGDGRCLRAEYECLTRGVRPTDSLYPLFVEMTWRLTRPGHSVSALVLPLSIAYHRGRQYVACRRAMVRKGGVWKFAFFDREPHALFGEEVKTRNAIVFRRETSADPPRGCESKIFTGPLRKWTSRTRDRLFESIGFTELPTYDLSNGIPKVAGAEQTTVVSILSHLPHRLARIWVLADSCLPEETFGDHRQPFVHVAGTAYNFLNVFRCQEPQARSVRTMSQSPVARLHFSDEQTAARVFAIMSSRLVFWLWHVHGDGFHVSRRFLEEIPFDDSSFTVDQRGRLSELGTTLWHELQQHIAVSVNRGRATIAYRPLACDETRARIDAILIAAAGIHSSFGGQLGRFVRDVVVVDESDNRRALLWPDSSRLGATR